VRGDALETKQTFLGHATDIATAAVAERFGDGAVDGKIQGHVVSIRA
jgi:hypothetical protein